MPHILRTGTRTRARAYTGQSVLHRIRLHHRARADHDIESLVHSGLSISAAPNRRPHAPMECATPARRPASVLHFELVSPVEASGLQVQRRRAREETRACDDTMWT